jgi:Big-like domain-containing protein
VSDGIRPWPAAGAVNRALWGVAAVVLAWALPACAGAPPQITSLSPVNGTKGVPADQPIVVTFDRAVDPLSVGSRFHVDPAISGCDVTSAFTAAPTAPCRVVWRSDTSGFSLLHTGALFAPDTTYHFSLDPGIRDPNGVANGLDHHWQIQTASAPVVRSTNPGDGTGGLAVDAPLSVQFSAAMQVSATRAAIHLLPEVAGTRVVVNATDHSRFVVLPGRLLAPNTEYTLSVGQGAADEHGQPLAAGVDAHFTTGGLGNVAHAVVLARRPGEAPSVVELTRRSPEQPGEPPASVGLIEATRCGLLCTTPGQPQTAYIEAAAAPSGARAAVIERPADGSADRLVVIDALGQTEQTIASPASHPAWSADGSVLAYGAGDRIDLYNAMTGTISRLPAGDPLVAPPVWSADGSVLALPVQHPGAGPHVELADPVLLVRYPVPGLAGTTTDPALSPDGSVLAVRLQQPSPGTWLIQLRSADVSTQLLGAALTPVAWTDRGTLIAISRPGGGPDGLVRVSVASGDSAQLPTGPLDSDLSTVTADVGGRSIGYLLADSAGVLQAWAMNPDGSNPTQLTSFAPDDGLEAVAVSLGG